MSCDSSMWILGMFCTLGRITAAVEAYAQKTREQADERATRIIIVSELVGDIGLQHLLPRHQGGGGGGGCVVVGRVG